MWDTTFFSYGDFIVGLNIELQNRRNIVNWFSWTPTYFVGIDYQRILPKHREVNWLIAKGAAGLCFSMNIFRNKMSLYFGPNIGEAYNFKINERESLFGPQFRSHFVALTSLDYGLRVNFKKSSISLGGNSIHYFSEEKDNATNWGIKYGFDL